MRKQVSAIIGPSRDRWDARSPGFYLSLLAGIVILGVSIFGYSGLFGRPDMPWDALAGATGLPREELVRAVVRADGFDIGDIEFDFKFIAARHRIGDPIEFVFSKDGREIAVREALVPYYADRGLTLVYLLTGLAGFLIGFGVFVRCKEDPKARLFYWLCLAFSSSVVISGAWYGLQGRPLHLVPGVLFYFAYTLTPVILLKFAMTFTARRKLPGEPFLWGASLVFGAFFDAVLVASFLIPSIAAVPADGLLHRLPGLLLRPRAARPSSSSSGPTGRRSPARAGTRSAGSSTASSAASARSCSSTSCPWDWGWGPSSARTSPAPSSSSCPWPWPSPS